MWHGEDNGVPTGRIALTVEASSKAPGGIGGNRDSRRDQKGRVRRPPGTQGRSLRGKGTDRQPGGGIADGVRGALIVDTSALLAFFDRGEPDHQSVSETLRAGQGAFVISPY